MPRPPEPVTRRELRLADRAAHRRGREVAPWVAVAVAAALLGGGTAQAYTDRTTLARHEVIATALAQERAALLRAQAADGARLDAQAVSYAGARRSEALAAAQIAVTVAQAVTASAATGVGPDVLAPLDSAAADLSALIASVPAALPAAEPAPAAVQTSVEVRPEAATSTPAPTSTTSAPTASTTTAPPPASTAAPTEPGTTIAFAESLAVSARMLAAAQVVSDLSAQVQAVAGANAAQATAAEAATQAATRAAAQAGADELDRRVATARASTNGAISADVLCALSFAPKALLRCDAAAALEQLDVAFRAQFHRDLVVSSSYRTFDEQVAVKAVRGDLAAAAGSSNHGLGIAIDFAGFGTVGAFGEPTYLWMKENAGQFGWNHPAIMEPGGHAPQEPWHWEFATV